MHTHIDIYIYIFLFFLSFHYHYYYYYYHYYHHDKNNIGQLLNFSAGGFVTLSLRVSFVCALNKARNMRDVIEF